ncbi:hypothetical protein Zmor_022600 [Zophobas morio]|uniref:STAS domain-containing protein n=2 Tax=Zophobas morio TaxID=2755281 RepID=A0AA38M661_9CUCU|nr:hypothetical protein Zmor_022600 [Zophobas morio]
MRRLLDNMNYKEILKKRVPIIEWLPRYTVLSFFRDLLAGFTVSLTAIPQSIALAGVAGLPPQYGLYSCVVAGAAYAVFGTCKDLNVGPTSILALMTEPYSKKFGPAVAPLLSFLGGLIIFGLGVFNLGFVIEFFSFPIVSGFTCAAALEIGSIQVNNFFGISSKGDDFLEAWKAFIKDAGKIKLWDTVLGATSLLALILLRELKRFGSLRYRSDWSRTRNIVGITLFLLSLARNAIVIIAGVVLAYCLRDQQPFRVIGEVQSGFPSFKPPDFNTVYNGTYYSFNDMATGIGTSLLFIPLIAILEAVSIAKTFVHGKSLDATQEILALGITNVLSSFVSSMPVTSGFTKSAINNVSGVKTPFGGVIVTVMAILAIAFLTPTFFYVPKATLAAVIICAMIYLFEYESFAIIWKNKKLDMIPFLVTLICCLTISLDYGILIGIGVNLLFILYPSARPKVNIVRTQIVKEREICVVKPMENLFFPAAEHFRDRILECKGHDIVVVVDGEYLRTIDVTVARSLVTLAHEMSERGDAITFWNFKPSVAAVCLGLDATLDGCFKTAVLEDIIQDSRLKVI